MTIRKALISDKKRILTLVQYLYEKSSPETVGRWRRNYEMMSRSTFIYEIKNEIVAYIACGIEKDSIYIGDLYVLPKFRRRRIAAELIKIINKVRKNLKKKYLRVDVRTGDKAAVKFYEKLGFKFWKKKGLKSLKLRK